MNFKLIGKNVVILFANPYFGVNNVLIQPVDLFPLMDNKAHKAYMELKDQHHLLPSDHQVLSHFQVHRLHHRTPMAFRKERQ